MTVKTLVIGHGAREHVIGDFGSGWSHFIRVHEL